MINEKYEKITNLLPQHIMQYQQNRYPLFFLDYIYEIHPGISATGYKNFSYNEWFFPSHFADEPNVPGFIQIEALTQMFIMTFLSIPENKGKKTGFASIKNAKFKKKIVPGDRLDISATLNSYKRGLARGISIGYVKNEVACELELEVVIPDIFEKYIPLRRGI